MSIEEKILQKLEKIDRIAETVDDIRSTLDEIVLPKLNENESRFDRMDSRFDAMDQRFDRMDSRFDAMDQRMEKMEMSHVSLDLYVREKLVTRDEFGASNAKLIDAVENVTLKVQRIEDDNVAKGEWMKRVETRLHALEAGSVAA